MSGSAGVSLLVMVPVAWPSPIAAFDAPLTLNLSGALSSSTVSLMMVTETVLVVSPAAKVMVALAAV